MTDTIKPLAYLYHDAASVEEINPLWHSTLLVFANERRPTARNETPLYPQSAIDAAVAAAVAQERERARTMLEGLHLDARGRHNCYLYALQLIEGKL